MVVDKDNNLVSFGVSIPSLSRALQRANGKLFPLGWLYLLLAFKKFKVVDLMLIGSAPARQSKGLSSILHTVMEGTYYKLKLKSAISNPQLEDNNAIKVWDTYNKEPYMRRRCWIRKIQ